MSAVTRSSLLAFAVTALVQLARAQIDESISPYQPLFEKRFEYNNLPYKVDTLGGLRGPQSGYNICNSTTQGQDALCQTLIFNNISDFCMWGPHGTGQTIGDTEGSQVAWCTRKEHGARLIPQDTFTGIQMTRAKGYIQLMIHFKQTNLQLLPDDFGGELDPHGADLRGNPLGGLAFSDAFSGGRGLSQVWDWHQFIGGNRTCLKLCDPAGPDMRKLCENRMDRLGIEFNCPNAAKDDVFEVCDSDDQEPVGFYTVNGVVSTYTQPEGSITGLPHTPTAPASSNCVTYQSSELFTSLFALPTTSSASTSKPTGSTRPSGSSSVSGSRTSSGGPAPTGGASSAAGAAATISLAATIFGVLSVVAFLS